MLKWYCLLTFVLLAGVLHAQQIPNASFESNDFTSWQADAAWTICGPDYTGDQGKNGKDGQYFASSFPGGEPNTGVLKSSNFTVPTDLTILEFLIAGFNQYPGQTDPNDHNYVSVKKAADASEIARIYAPQGNDFATRRIDLKDYKGQSVYIEVVDDCALAGYAWMAVDGFHFVAPPPVSANLDFEMGDFTHWTATGAWIVAGPGGSATAQSRQGSFYAVSTEAGTGTLKSENMTVAADKTVLDFLIAGWSMYPVAGDPQETGPNAYNYVSIKKASDNSEVARIYGPGGDAFVEKQIDLNAVKGQQVYLEVVDDGNKTGFAWLAVDDFHFIAAPKTRTVFDSFETGAFDPAKWTVEGSWEVVTAGQGFGGTPSDGTYAAKSCYDRANNTSADSLTGTLTSAPIPITYQDTLLKFDMCGHDGVPTDPLANECYLAIYLSTDLNTPVATVAPPRQDAFKISSFNVEPYREKKLVLKLVDNRTGGFGWFGIDFIRIEYDPNIVPVELSSFSAE